LDIRETPIETLPPDLVVKGDIKPVEKFASQYEKIKNDRGIFSRFKKFLQR